MANLDWGHARYQVGAGSIIETFETSDCARHRHAHSDRLLIINLRLQAGRGATRVGRG